MANPPSERQIDFAFVLAAELGLDVPEKVTVDAKECSSFIDHCKAEKEKGRTEWQTAKDRTDFLARANGDLIVTPQMRRAVRAASSIREAIEKMREFQARPRPPIARARSADIAAIIGYWTDALERTAFDGLAKQPNRLKGPFDQAGRDSQRP